MLAPGVTPRPACLTSPSVAGGRCPRRADRGRRRTSVSVTVSVGGACMPEHADHARELDPDRGPGAVPGQGGTAAIACTSAPARRPSGDPDPRDRRPPEPRGARRPVRRRRRPRLRAAPSSTSPTRLCRRARRRASTSGAAASRPRACATSARSASRPRSSAKPGPLTAAEERIMRGSRASRRRAPVGAPRDALSWPRSSPSITSASTACGYPAGIAGTAISDRSADHRRRRGLVRRGRRHRRGR